VPENEVNQNELDTALEAVRNEVKRAAEPILKEANAKVEEMKRLHTDLMSHHERGTSHEDQKVLDLSALKEDVEARIVESNEMTRALFNEIKESNAVLAPKTSGVDLWRGFFLGDERDSVLQEHRKLLGENRYDDAVAVVMRAITSGTTLSSAGKLNPDQENRFLDWMIERQVALNTVQIRRMRAPSAYLDELVTAERQIRAGTEGSAPAVSDAFTTARRTLDSVETVWAEDVTDSFVEDNIERGDIENHIAMNLARQFGNDHNDLFWNGDEADSDLFVGINDGIITIAKADASVNDYDATSDTTVVAVLEQSLKDMDYQYRGIADLAWFMPDKTAFVLMTELADRATPLGDSFVTNANGDSLPFSTTRYFGIPILGDPDLGRGTQDEGVFTPRSNLVWALQRGIRLESERAPRKRAVEFTLSARTDQNYTKSEAVVLIDNIAAALRS
jgi:hypothetical protein